MLLGDPRAARAALEELFDCGDEQVFAVSIFVDRSLVRGTFADGELMTPRRAAGGIVLPSTGS